MNAPLVGHDDQDSMRRAEANKEIFIAIEYQNKGNVDAAKGIFEGVLKQDAINFPALYSLAVIEYQSNTWQRGLNLITAAILVNPNFSQAHYVKGAILQSLKQYELACDAFGKALELNPQYSEAHQAQAVLKKYLARTAELTLRPLAEHANFNVIYQTADTVAAIQLPAVVGLSYGGSISVPMDKDYLCEFDGVTIQVFSDFIRSDDGFVSCQKLYRKEHEVLIAKDQDLISRTGNVIKLRKAETCLQFDFVFNLFGTYMNHWGHFLAELYPKLAYLDKLPQHKKIHLPIWDDIDPHIFHLIERETGQYPNIELVSINRETSVFAKKLYHVELGTFVGNHSYTPSLFHVQISPSTNEFWKKTLSPPVDSMLSLDNRKKLFVGRKGVRSLANYAEVLDFFTARGFEEVFPHLLSFDDKVALFRSASHVVGPFSSGFMNIFFSHSNTRILGFTNAQRNQDTFFPGFCNLVGQKFWLMCGQDVEATNIHSDYHVDLGQIKTFVDEEFFA